MGKFYLWIGSIWFYCTRIGPILDAFNRLELYTSGWRVIRVDVYGTDDMRVVTVNYFHDSLIVQPIQGVPFCKKQ